MDNIKTGITSEVLTISSKKRIIEIFNDIINKKSLASVNWINNLNMSKDSKICIAGTYFTGIGIAKALKSEGYSDVLIVDIYSHLKDFIDSEIGGESYDIKFSTDLNLIKNNDILVDTTGFGGLSPEFSKDINVKAFLIEDPVAEDNDVSLGEKNNIYLRLDDVKCGNKGVLKTLGLDTKTSGTMSLTAGVLLKSVRDAMKLDGVLYSCCEMRFFEDIVFKEKDISKFLILADISALKVSSIKEYDVDGILEDNLGLIESCVFNV